MSDIPFDDEEIKILPKTVKIKLDTIFSDKRGKIIPILDLPIKSCVLITSKKDTIRGNHYHKTDWHFCYVLNGSIEYYYKPVDDSEPIKKVKIKKGELFFTPPQVIHAMVFRENTTFLTLGRNSRKQEVYESDIVRIELIS